MDMTPRRQQMIETHVADTRRAMLDCAFELNDLVRFALAAAKDKPHKRYYPFDPVDEGIRNWAELRRKLAKLTALVERANERLGSRPFEPEQPAGDDPESAAG
jgi:hypothetical protein